ncbi:MAG: DeoR/GlpR family DNA-binding transcription regulator [Spirochaetia bacterium]
MRRIPALIILRNMLRSIETEQRTCGNDVDMLKAERQANILKMLQERPFLTTDELCSAFAVSVMTARRDIRELNNQGLVSLEHGGVSIAGYLQKFVEPAYQTKYFINRKQKEAIGREAAGRISDSDSVLLDSGTTTLQIAKALAQSPPRNVTVFTNDIAVAKELSVSNTIQVISLGGVIRPSYFAAYGLFTEMALQSIRADKLFLAVDGASRERGLSNSVYEEIPVKHRMIEAAEKVYVVCDSSKFSVDTAYRVCGWDTVQEVITDGAVQPEFLSFFEKAGIALGIAESSGLRFAEGGARTRENDG